MILFGLVILQDLVEDHLVSKRSLEDHLENRAEFPRCFPENVDLNFLGFRNPVFSIDTIWNPILEAVFVSFVWVNSCRKD